MCPRLDENDGILGGEKGKWKAQTYPISAKQGPPPSPPPTHTHTHTHTVRQHVQQPKPSPTFTLPPGHHLLSPQLENVSTPTKGHQAPNKDYVDDQINTRVAKSYS